MKSNPKLSIIMSEHNTPIRFLRESINSILAQTLKDFELIIVDDCGHNDLRAIAQEYSDDRIKIIKNEKNRGLVHSLNDAISYARSAYLVRMDTDDIAEPQRFERLYAFACRHPEYAVVGSRVIEFSEEGEQGILCKSGEKTKESLIKGDGLIHPSVIMRKHAVEDVGNYPDYQRAEDFALWAELLLHGYRLYVLEDSLLKYRVNTGDYSKRKLKYRQGELMAKLHYFPLLGAKPSDYRYIIKSIISGILPTGLVRRYRKKFVVKPNK